ncbi:MAG TPA: FkbM family methyltransferase [bacterium]|nr:FkbM family methyltransferase [bacterium]
MKIKMAQQVKKILSENSFLYRLLSKIYHSGDKLWLPKQKPLEEILESYSHFKNDVFFIQIGSNDGVEADPINKYINQYNWQGLLVEPVTYLFERLKRNYSSKQHNLIFENSAISNNDGEASFYRLKVENDPNLPRWYHTIGSFNKEIILKHKKNISNFDDLLIEEKIKTISLDTLLLKHNIENVDLIEIDTEGYDFEIIKLINFNKLKIDIIIFEHIHLTTSDYKKSIKLIKRNGFKLFAYKENTIGIRKNYYSGN